MQKIEGVILDWAGTTVDYGCFAPVKVFMEIFQKRGIAVTEEETRKPMGMLKRDHIKTMLSMERISMVWKKQFGSLPTEADAEALYTDFEPMLLASLKDYATPKPHVLETIAVLRERGVKIGSTTGYTDSMMEIVSASAKQAGYAPDFWITPDATKQKGRPYPYMIFHTMEALGLGDVRRIIKVGDTVSDIKEGKQAGVWSVGVVEGSSEMSLSQQEFEALGEDQRQFYRKKVEQIFLQAGADFVIQDFRGVLKVIASIETSAEES